MNAHVIPANVPADPSYIGVDANNRPHSYVGPAAVDFFRVRTLKSGIAMHAKCGIIPTRGMTITRMLEMATTYTGKKYKRGMHADAIADLDKVLAGKLETLEVRVK